MNKDTIPWFFDCNDLCFSSDESLISEVMFVPFIVFFLAIPFIDVYFWKFIETCATFCRNFETNILMQCTGTPVNNTPVPLFQMDGNRAIVSLDRNSKWSNLWCRIKKRIVFVLRILRVIEMTHMLKTGGQLFKPGATGFVVHTNMSMTCPWLASECKIDKTSSNINISIYLAYVTKHLIDFHPHVYMLQGLDYFK
jgi:hypothetical protein